ncbi:hypothetical protein OJF2_29340 [Aquisphaera giovannonii]|uniref:Lipoprotein n=2 Tax=Aquisphaera giovannonii TaxID=406548 RepID=A0A5B9W2V2_9BACT|nr:hypothetical protein OJF2_29340 [Aquisphaera giovannonii]
MIAIPRRRAAARFALLPLVAALAGCGGTPAPAVAPQEQARQTLDQALAAWAEGKTVDAVKAGSPSILVEDPQWKKGVALKKFEVRGEGKPSGAERVFTVKLTLSDSGKEKTQEVDYKVGTSPIFTVFRSMF